MRSLPAEIRELVDRGAVFYLSHSGGKDSQAMYLYLAHQVPQEQLVLVHADLGEVEWDGVQEHILDTTSHELNVVRAGKTLLEMVETRFQTRPEVPSWPSSSTRASSPSCSRRPSKTRTAVLAMSRLSTTFLAVNCTGIRAEESAARSKKSPFQLNKRLSKAGREVYEWMPIFELTTEQVFQAIADAGQEPHWAYQENERLSCVFCIMGCASDLAHGAKQRPGLLQKYLDLEAKTGWTMFGDESLADKINRGGES